MVIHTWLPPNKEYLYFANLRKDRENGDKESLEIYYTHATTGETKRAAMCFAGIESLEWIIAELTVALQKYKGVLNARVQEAEGRVITVEANFPSLNGSNA